LPLGTTIIVITATPMDLYRADSLEKAASSSVPALSVGQGAEVGVPFYQKNGTHRETRHNTVK
jgi:hypothetical protein